MLTFSQLEEIGMDTNDFNYGQTVRIPDLCY